MPTQYATTFRAMGCQTNVWLETDADGSALLRQVPIWIEEIEAQLSRFRPESELSRLNAQAGQWVDVSPVLLDNINAAKQGARLTGGLYNPFVLDALLAAGYDRSFDQIAPGKARSADVASWEGIEVDLRSRRVRLPAGIDLGGVAKGWTASLIADRLKSYGACLVDIGGDMSARGCPEGRGGWEIAVADPIANGEAVRVSLMDASIVTSGTDYRRWLQEGQPRHHLIDPRTGQPANTDVLSVTVIHPHGPTAEAYSKAILMQGSQAGLEWLNQQWRGAALVICHDGAVLMNHRFESYILSM